MLPLTTILHPTDFSPSAAAAYKLACSLARDTGARLIVLHVTARPTVVYGTGVVPVDPETEQRQLREMLHTQHPVDPKVQQEYHLALGEPVTEVLREAEEKKANLIVMGTHGRMGLTRMLMGSVAEQVLRRANCPVLIARLPE